MILYADWSISRLQSWTCSSLPTVAEFVKLTQSIVNSATVRRLVQSPTLQSTIFCSVHSGLRGKGIRVSPAWLSPVFSTNVVVCVKTQQNHEGSNIMIKPNNSIISLMIQWHVFHSAAKHYLTIMIIPIQVALHHCPHHALPQTVIPIQLTLLACIIAHMSHHNFFSKAVVNVLTKVVKAYLGTWH